MKIKVEVEIAKNCVECGYYDEDVSFCNLFRRYLKYNREPDTNAFIVEACEACMIARDK